MTTVIDALTVMDGVLPEAVGGTDSALARKLARVPADYQERFRQTIQDQMRNAGQDHADSDVLAFLKQRQQSIESGDYIRPDGKMDTIILDPVELYTDGSVAEMLNEGDTDAAGNTVLGRFSRETVLKIAGLTVLLLALFLVVNRGQQQRLARNAEPTPSAAAAGTAPEAGPAGPTPTPTIVAPIGADATLQTIGGLGGTLTLGRPSALTLRYSATEETVALPIDPARISNRGELPFNVTAMASDSPVAVWVFGTVLNYALGLPPGLVQALQPGDRLRLSTDTGFSLAFVVTETGTRASHETGALLSQDRVGMTLFGLPATAADGVQVAIASYDLTAEDALTAVYKDVGQPLFAGSDLQITDVVFSDRSDGQLDVTVSGSGQGIGVLALHARSHQTTAVTLPAADPWQLTFALPATVIGESLTAVYRQLEAGTSAYIQLGAVPQLTSQLVAAAPEAVWQPETGEMVVVTEVTNPGPGQVCLPPDYMQIPMEGGDAYSPIMPVATCLMDGETQSLRLTFPHPGPETPLVVQVGEWLWGTR